MTCFASTNNCGYLFNNEVLACACHQCGTWMLAIHGSKSHLSLHCLTCNWWMTMTKIITPMIPACFMSLPHQLAVEQHHLQDIEQQWLPVVAPHHAIHVPRAHHAQFSPVAGLHQGWPSWMSWAHKLTIWDMSSGLETILELVFALPFLQMGMIH